jgi:membrane protein insertase Oxa1/YidC/SpoIIIJ
MGWNLPAGMGIYWLLGSLISIFQTLIMELIQTRNRHKFAENTGDGSTLAAVRRSKHHSSTKAEADKKAAKKNKSDKPMWR